VKLSNPSILSVSVDPDAYMKSPRDHKTLYYLLDRLFSGQEVAVEELEAWGIRVTLVDEFVKIERMD
jgi:hypothetical protein